MITKRKAARILIIIFVASWCFFSRTIFGNIQPVVAQTGQPTVTPTPGNPHEDTSKCLGCHSNPDMKGFLSDGNIISLFFDAETHPNIGHTSRCAACHDAEQVYPHEGTRSSSCSGCHWNMVDATPRELGKYEFKLSYPDERAISLDVNESCSKCHKEKFEEYADSAHLRILLGGNRYAPVCVDCHKSHEIVLGALTRQSVAKTCSECHLAVYTTYRGSVHGAALEKENNQDVPTCGDCHGIHDLSGPADVSFRADSILTCGNCHSDPDRMDKYGISTEVLDTYLDDFHGRTVDFFRQTDASQITKATCYDCHGIHNIYNTSDEKSTVYPANLQKTCQHCHPDADIRFPDAWLSHYVPTWEQTPVLYAVNLAYQIMIPGLVGGFVLYILLDARRRVFAQFKKRKAQRAKRVANRHVESHQ